MTEAQGEVPSLVKRSVVSVSWNMMASLVNLPIGFVQSILLARLLAVEHFGVYAGMMAIVVISGTLFELGLSGAYYHRAPETQDEEQTTAIFFTLRLISCLFWSVILILIALVFLDGLRSQVLIYLALLMPFNRILNTPATLLMRRVQHQRLAFLDMTISTINAVISVTIAWLTRSIWALLISPVIVSLCTFSFLYVYKPIWKPRFAWDKPIIKYHLSFGSRNVVGNFIGGALDHLDDLWTNIYLGDRLLGYYSRAYRFALFPRHLLAEPVNAVALGTYAELKYDRLRLSQAFFRMNALLIRSGFMIGGWLAVIAPYFIRLFLGERWLPMLEAFRLMLVFTLFDPLRVTISGVLIAVGKPEKASFAQFVQLLVMVAGLFALGLRFQIAGVALAVDLMLLVGIGLVMFFARPYVDFSLARLFGVPAVALACGIGACWLTTRMCNQLSDWMAILVLSAIFAFGYVGVLIGLEGNLLFRSMDEMFHLRTRLKDWYLNLRKPSPKANANRG